MKRSLALLVLAVGVLCAQAQDKAVYEKIVKDLSSVGFNGRSDYMDGSANAMKYIIDNLNVNASYSLQLFDFPMNTFRGNMEVYVDGKKFELFSDYVVKEFSTGRTGTFNLFYLDKEFYNTQKFAQYLDQDQFSNSFIVIDFELFKKRFFKKGIEPYQKYLSNLNKIAGIIFTTESRPVAFKSRAQYTLPFPVLLTGKTFPGNAKEIYINLENEFRERHNANNIVAWLPGKKYSDKYFVICAHYDHLGMMGRGNIMYGANDNASGVAMAMTLLNYYSTPENRPDYPFMFIFFDGEEANLLGSIYYADYPVRPLKDIECLINLDMVGDTGPNLRFQADDRETDLLKKVNKEGRFFKKLIKEELNDDSDHYPFARRHIPYLYLTIDGVNKDKYYHSPNDTFANFSSEQYDNLFNLVTNFIKKHKK